MFPRLLFTALLGSTVAWAAAPAQYYPHAPGTRWTYANGETQVVGAPLKYKGLMVVPVNHQFGNVLVTQDLLEYRADGSVWLRGVNVNGKLQWYTPALNVYPPAPLKIGQIWNSSVGQIKSTSQVIGTQAVKSGKQTYNALMIQTSSKVSGRETVQVIYFVPTIGVVRYQTADGNLIDLLPGK